MRTLVIVPTKDRPECINIFVQNLLTQPGEFDLFIADMCTDPELLKTNWLLDKALRRLQHQGHNWMVARVEGSNQLYGYNQGLALAHSLGYETAVASDDDCVLQVGWICQLQNSIERLRDASVVAGITLLPWMSEEEQTCPDWFVDHKDHAGTLDQSDYYHATLIPPWTEPRAYEQLYGPFMFRVQDFCDVGGFPRFLSPLGFRGEMWPMEACFFRGNKLYIDPKAICWHYSASYGGLKLVSGSDREKYLKMDTTMWEEFIRNRREEVRP